MGEWRQPNSGAQLHPRVDASISVRVSTVDPETDPNTGKHFFRSAEETTANLSQGGAFVRSWEPLAAGRRVIVDFDLAEDGRLQLLASVAWTQRQVRAGEPQSLDAPGFGVQFVEASDEELARLDRYLARVERDEARAKPHVAPSPPN